MFALSRDSWPVVIVAMIASNKTTSLYLGHFEDRKTFLSPRSMSHQTY